MDALTNLAVQMALLTQQFHNNQQTVNAMQACQVGNPFTQVPMGKFSMWVTTIINNITHT